MPGPTSFRSIAEQVSMPSLQDWAYTSLGMQKFDSETKTGVVSEIMRERRKQKYPIDVAKAEL
jgi:hypothetical protein